MIAQNLQKLIGVAMKAGDKTRVETLRMLSSSFNYEKIAKQHDLTPDEEISVIRKQVKQRKESIEAYEKANRPDLVIPEKAQLDILSEFLPPEMNEDELIKIINEVIADLPADATHQALQAGMGKVIAEVKAKTGGNVDGGLLASLVRQKLNG